MASPVNYRVRDDHFEVPDKKDSSGKLLLARHTVRRGTILDGDDQAFLEETYPHLLVKCVRISVKASAGLSAPAMAVASVAKAISGSPIGAAVGSVVNVLTPNSEHSPL